MTRYAEPSLPMLPTVGPFDIRRFNQDLLTALGVWGLSLKGLLDGGLSLSDNVDCDVVSYTSNVAANTEDAVAHGLGKTPTYFIVADINKGGVVYRSTTAFTNAHVYLKCSTVSTALKIILF